MQKAAIEYVTLIKHTEVSILTIWQGAKTTCAREPDCCCSRCSSSIRNFWPATKQHRESTGYRFRRCGTSVDAEPAAIRSIGFGGIGRYTTTGGIPDFGRTGTVQQHGRSHGPVWQRRSSAGTGECSERSHERIRKFGLGCREPASACGTATVTTTAEIEQQRSGGFDLMTLRLMGQGVRRSGKAAWSWGPTESRRSGAHERSPWAVWGRVVATDYVRTAAGVNGWTNNGLEGSQGACR